jgi:CubicO group peptidase (beta-lactamase class C family)
VKRECGSRKRPRASEAALTSLHNGDLRAGRLPGTGFGPTSEVTRQPLGTPALMSIGSFGHGGAFGTHGWIDPANDLVGVFLIQHAGYTGNAKAVFMGMVGSVIND